MIKAHVFLDNKLMAKKRMEHAPRVGDTIRMKIKGVEEYGIVNEVVWCLDEQSNEGQRVNIGAKKEIPK